MNLLRGISLIAIIAILYCSCSKSKTPVTPVPNPTLPTLSILDISHNRDNKIATAFRFFISVSSASDKDIKVNYATSDSTAKSGIDYTMASGTLTIPASQTLGYVDVTMSGDSLRQPDQTFYLTISNPVNATIKGSPKAIGTITTNGTYYPSDNEGYYSPSAYPGYTLTWSDEFNDAAINTNNWNFETGGGGWGNHELEYYTPGNAFLANGKLVIEARQETIGSNNYTSARMNTAGKQSFKYGRIDMRAKIPVSHGMWPALWMLGTNIATTPWPGCGETDIMELIGSSPNRVVGSIHWAQADGSSGTVNNAYFLSSGDFSLQFHVFSLVWQMNYVQIIVDGIPYMTATNSSVTSGTWPFNAPFFFIFNVAVGGDWPGSPDATTIFPQRMYVDYVRVFQ